MRFLYELKNELDNNTIELFDKLEHIPYDFDKEWKWMV